MSEPPKPAHGGAQRFGIDGASAFEMGQQQPAAAIMAEAVWAGGSSNGDAAASAAAVERREFMGEVRRAGTGETGGVLSLTPSGSPLPAALFLSEAAAHGLPPSAAMTAAHLRRPAPECRRAATAARMIVSAGVVAPAFAHADQDAVVRAHAGLGHLDVDGRDAA